MFTGIIQTIGRVDGVEHRGDGSRLVINTGGLGTGSLAIGDSIAVNGVCLTAVQTEDSRVALDVSRETLDCTTLVDLQVAGPVNLELALLPTTRLCGHLVSRFGGMVRPRIRFAAGTGLQPGRMEHGWNHRISIPVDCNVQLHPFAACRPG